VSDSRPKTSSRDHAVLREQVLAWLGTRVTNPAISELSVPPTNGMSSETVLFDLASGPANDRIDQRCVLRLPPDPTAYPVFRTYDMERQYRAMRYAAAHSSVPVPPTLWLETDTSFLGAAFFVMGRVDGVVPPDLMPYPFGGNFLYDASPADQQRLQRTTIETLAKLHAIDVAAADAQFLALDFPGDTALQRHVNESRAYYEWTVADGIRSPIIEKSFAWLDANWPTEGDPVLSWGDSRIGNIMYRDFEPVAVLDWEMVAEGPREIDLGWCIYIHQFFQGMAKKYGAPGMPDFMGIDDVTAQYEAASGVAVRDLRWYIVYAALRYAIVSARINRRQVHFGELVMPDNPDDAIMSRDDLVAMFDGSFWSDK
jgi:aminoglycoside phosphotransferase (APT) family kinase protein